MKKYLFLIFIILLLVLTGCAECKKASDCEAKSHFVAQCTKKECSYTAIPDKCGNDICEDKENPCTCPVDCGICQGTKSAYTELKCIENQCVESIQKSQLKPLTLTSDISSAGNKFRITTDFNTPFNLKKDLFKIKFSILNRGTTTKDIKITKLALTGRTKDKRVIQIAEKNIQKYLWYGGTDLEESLILDIPSEISNDILNTLELVINFDYTYVSGIIKGQKSSSMKIRYTNIKAFTWVRPESDYPCPESCDDNNEGTKDSCVDSFCVNKPIANSCGNFICEVGENPCICTTDCGPCTGDGVYTSFSCLENQCIAQLKPGMEVKTSSIFDERNLNYFHMQNNYNFNNPFNTAVDKIKLKFNLYDKKNSITNLKITDIRLFEGVNEIAYTQANLILPKINSFQTVQIEIPSQTTSEIEKTLGLKVWYEFNENGELKRGSYTKPLGKLFLISPI